MNDTIQISGNNLDELIIREIRRYRFSGLPERQLYSLIPPDCRTTPRNFRLRLIKLELFGLVKMIGWDRRSNDYYWMSGDGQYRGPLAAFIKNGGAEYGRRTD